MIYKKVRRKSKVRHKSKDVICQAKGVRLIDNATLETWFIDGIEYRHFALVASKGMPAKIYIDGTLADIPTNKSTT